jgi:phospholipid-translocating ATPase
MTRDDIQGNYGATQSRQGEISRPNSDAQSSSIAGRTSETGSDRERIQEERSDDGQPSNSLPGETPSSRLDRRTSHPKVRFSADLDRVQHGPSETLPMTGFDRRPGSRALTIDTSVAKRTSSPLSRSPETDDMRTVTLNSAESPISPPSATSPLSRARNRGYSLRRTLFSKSITSPSEGNGDQIIEMVPSQSAHSSDRIEEKEHVEDTILPTTSEESEFQDDADSVVYSDSAPLKYIASFTARRRYASAASATAFARLSAFAETVRKTILRIPDIPPTKDGRHIDLDVNRTETPIDERTGKPYIDNSIRSSRYSLWSFFPRQLVAQFSKLANFYFLVVSILQMIPGLSTTGTFTTIIPLMIFVSISMGKEGFDDWRRYRLDKEENNRYAHVLRPRNEQEARSTSPADDEASIMSNQGGWTVVKWRDIRVGDVIKLERDQHVPADIVLLHADGPNGVAYIETMALDGETNLKSKQPCQPVAKLCATVEDISQQGSLHFTVEDPNIDLYKFEGNVTVGGNMYPLTNNEIVYRGSILRNTERVYAMVIYTGEECKIRMNANKNPRIKRPALQSQVNLVVMIIVTIVLILAIVCTVAYHFWAKDVEAKSWYLLRAHVPIGQVFTSFLIMFNTLIPISLYVSMEIVKVAQMFLLNDIDMYDEESDTPLEARTSTINEELGQISYIFSDKTGTLTNNSMRFRRMSVAGTAWLHDTDLREEAAREGERQRLIHKKRSIKGKKAVRRKSYADETNRTSSVRISTASTSMHLPGHLTRPKSINQGKPFHGGNTMQMLEYIQRKPYTLFARRVKFFILSMAICHTCIPEEDAAGKISFQAASPDELALVQGAQELGYLVIDRQPNTLTVRTFPSGPDDDPVDEVYEILDVIEFTSTRKRMSVVVRMPDQRICLFCKGADSTIMKLLRQASLAHEKAGEIERRVSKRKTAEAIEVMRRNSELQGRTSTSRPSFSRRRSSVISGKQGSLRRSIDVWLKDRETDGGILTRDNGSEHYSPRPSAQLSRHSAALSDGRLSFQEDEGDAVDEALVVDEQATFERCFQHLNDFANEGLRTLMYAYRFIEDATYKDWKQAYQDATTSLVDRQEKIERVGEQIESQLELVGATAIEDKLQKGVPETIDKLRRANIKLWMLTGDKRETAINIGHSCRLVKDYSEVVILDHETGEVERTIITLTANIKKGKVAHCVVVVDGQTLSFIESDEILMARFFNLAILVDSVICCRASPKQKAFLVRSVRKQVTDSITLAIGDGANDIAMIQEAHVGIGITGKEGLQAARISDYSIAQFRFLLKLLLVHGRWNYIRVCKYTLGTFWKETLFYLTQALYQRWNGYTGTSLYEPWGLSMFNTLFTSLAVIFLGIFEKDLAASTLLAVPELYTKGQQHGGFSVRIYLGWAFMAVCEAMIVYFTMLGLFGEALISMDNTVYPLGLLTFTACVIVINVKLQCLEIHNRSILSAVVMFISIGGWFLWNILLAASYKDSTSGKGIYDVKGNFFNRTGRSLAFWVVLLLIVVAVVLFEVTVSTIRATLFPTDVDIFQEFEQDIEIRKRFEEAAASELQQGWDHGKKRPSLEIAREEAEMAEREQEVHELLSRPRVMGKSDSGNVQLEEVELHNYGDGSDNNDEEAGLASPGGGGRRSLDIHELFSKRFGTIKRGQELS